MKVEYTLARQVSFAIHHNGPSSLLDQMNFGRSLGIGALEVLGSYAAIRALDTTREPGPEPVRLRKVVQG